MYPQPDYPVARQVAEAYDAQGNIVSTFIYTNLPNGCLFDGKFIPDINVFKHEPVGDEDPAWPTFFFAPIYQIAIDTNLGHFQLDEGVTTQPPNPVTVTAGDWSSGDHIPPKVEPDFD